MNQYKQITVRFGDGYICFYNEKENHVARETPMGRRILEIQKEVQAGA